jgi:hypothetical protein
LKMRKLFAIFLIVIFVVVLSGCATNGYYDPARSTGAGALGGAAVGSALGSIIGAAVGAPGTGAWVGAAAGGVIGGASGYLYAQHRNSQTRDANLAHQAYSYNPGRGNIVQIENVNARPSTVKPGSQVNMEVSYTLLSPENQPQQVTIVREITEGGRQVTQPYYNQTTFADGTYTDNVALTIPREARPGSYTLTTKVMTSRATDQKSMTFYVQ